MHLLQQHCNMRIFLPFILCALAACQGNSKVSTDSSAGNNMVPKHTACKQANISAEDFRKHWEDYLHLKLLRCEKVMHGGFKKLEYSLDNDSPFMIDSVCLKINFLDEKQKLYKFENVTAVDIEQGESVILYAPESARGTSLETHIETLVVKDASLLYQWKKPKIKKHH